MVDQVLDGFLEEVREQVDAVGLCEAEQIQARRVGANLLLQKDENRQRVADEARDYDCQFEAYADESGQLNEVARHYLRVTLHASRKIHSCQKISLFFCSGINNKQAPKTLYKIQ